MNLPRHVPKFLLLILIFACGLAVGSFMSPSGGTVVIGEGQALPLNDRDYFPTVQHMIDSANSSVKAIIYSVNYYPSYPDSVGHMLLFDLEEAVKRGVDVRLITDQTPTEKPVLSVLRDMGVNVKFDSGDLTTHAKLIIIDSEIVIIGSTNWSYHSIDKNHEANVIVRSASLAKEFEDYFNMIWAES